MIKALLTNVYSNYFCQKLYSRLKINNEINCNKINFLSFIIENLKTISCNKTGTFSIQKIIELANSKQERNTILKGLQDISNEDMTIICNVSIKNYIIFN